MNDAAAPLTGSFYTPRAVIAAIKAIAPLRPGDRVDDAACGTGGVPSWALDHFKIADAVCRLEADADEDYGLVPRPDPALAVELERAHGTRSLSSLKVQVAG
ncbi:N-6 DNA methylase [Streptomyces sp. KS_5]|uniref:N-6 DNA methylase n=1 Tax=Streptomyces TaxID=1883 RepID=UPI0015A2BFA5|nr:N-6 DNA methylase [Streptomyces sp. KS_5]